MPRMILLNAAPTTTTGVPVYIGRAKPNFTIRTSGGYTVSTVSILSAPGSSDTAPAASAFKGEFGEIVNAASAETSALNALADAATAVIRHPVEWIRADTGGITGNATVTLIMNA